MSNLDHVVTKTDRRRLGSLLTTPAGRAWGTLETIGKLESLLEDATSVHRNEAPETLVTMNTTVKLVEPNSGARRTVTLVYPQDLGVFPNAVSVTDPLGVALIGCHVGDVIQSQEDASDGNLRVAEIIYQPEHAGARFL
jgi:regulator of nucleoside diphosphate kinase